MIEKTPSKVAQFIRPLLVELAGAVCLPTGILGVAFLGIKVKEQHPIFADFVEPDRDVREADQARKDEEARRKVHYSLSRYHPIVVCLKDPDEKCAVLSRKSAEQCKGDTTGGDVWVPLSKLFGSEDSVPESIRVWRVWLSKGRAALYYVPKAQKESVSEWNELSRVAILAGYTLRWTIIALRATGDIAPDDADLFLNCLPSHLPDHEEKLRDRLADADAYSRSAQDLSMEVRYEKANNSLLILGHVPRREPVKLARLAMPKKGDLEVPDATWVAGEGKPRGHRLIVSVLAIRKALAHRRRKADLAGVHSRCFWSFLHPEESPPWLHGQESYTKVVTATTDAKDVIYSGDEQIGSVYHSGRLNSGEALMALHRRVVRGAAYLSKEFGWDPKKLRPISHRWSEGERKYTLELDVDMNDATLRTFTSAGRDPSHWIYHLLQKVCDDYTTG